MTNARGPWSPDYCKVCGEMDTAHAPGCSLRADKLPELKLKRLKLFGKALKCFPSSPRQKAIHKELEEVCAEIAEAEEKPRLEPTAAGLQAIIPDTLGREIPRGGLKPKKTQTEKPTLLEMYETEQRQQKLF